MAKIISSLPGSTGVLSKTSQLINDGETGISTYVELNDLSTVATTGDYNNLINIPIDFTPKVHTHNISDISGTKSEFNTSLIDGNFLFVGDVSNTPDATTTSKGVIKLAGDLGGTADLPTVPNKLDKVSTAGVERAYIVNADGSQGTKATSEFEDVIETQNKLITIPLGDLGVAIEDVTYEMVSDYITNLGIVVEKGENYYFEVIEVSQETTDGLVIIDLTNSQPTP